MAVGRVWVRVTPLALLPVDCSADGRMSNEKTHGIRTVSSGQDTKADHGTTIASQEASDPNALRSGHEGEEPRQEEADAHVRVPALRLIRGDAHQWSEQSRSCPVIRGSGCPTKLTEPRSAGGWVRCSRGQCPGRAGPVHHQHILLAIELDLELFRRDSHDPNPRS